MAILGGWVFLISEVPLYTQSRERPTASSSSNQSVHLTKMAPRETDILLPNNQRQHHTSHAPEDVLPVRVCANHCAPS